MEIRATDAPPKEVTKILITVANIEVHKTTGDAWVNVVQGPVEFDLVEIQGVEETLGEAILEPGRYGQIRLEIEKAEVTVDGNVLSARVPSGKLRIAGGFSLESGDTTILTLDFDAEKSVVVAGTRNVLIKPVIKLLARKADKALAAADEVGGIDETSEASEESPSEATPEASEDDTSDEATPEASDDDTSDEATPEASDDDTSDEPTPAVTGPKAAVAVAEHSELGQILVDGEGLTLYMWNQDPPDTPTCTGGCAATWPPLLVSEVGLEPVGEGVNPDLLVIAPRDDGTTQVSYNGHPLYNFAADRNPGDAKGQNLGRQWFTVSPVGDPVSTP